MNARSMLNKASAFLAVTVISVSVLGFLSGDVRAGSGIDDFVNRCYKVAFQRDADQEGLDYWKDRIASHDIDGSLVVFNFMFSNEYLALNTSDRQFVNDLYTMFMGREPDDQGYSYWCGLMNNGQSRENVFAGFANSAEFNELCSSYGITAGFFSTAYPVDNLNKVNLFVERLYNICFGRIGDQSGQSYWVEGLLSGKLSGSDCAANYVMSAEYESMSLSDQMYIKNLYKALLGREADEEGLNYWLSQMNNKDDGRYFIFCSFANSAEFKDICASYGINCGVFAKEKVLKNGNETFYISPSGMYVRSEADITDRKGVTIHSEFIYDENGINIKRSNYVNGVLQEYIIYTYPSVDVMRCDVYDAKGNLTQYMITTYSGEQLQRVDFYTADGSFRGYITYDYSQGNTPVIHEYNADGVQVS